MWKLNPDSCTGCGECIKACPFQILEMAGGFPHLKDGAECYLCANCSDGCPEQAIELTMDNSAPSGASSNNL